MCTGNRQSRTWQDNNTTNTAEDRWTRSRNDQKCVLGTHRVGHDEIITQLTQLRIDGQDLGMIKNVYWKQTE